MRHSQTAVLERGEHFNAEFTTEPYEVAWAGEARFFVQVLEPQPSSTVVLTTQFSPDGLNWVDADGVDSVKLDSGSAGMVSWPVREFGGWLRLRGTVRDSPERGPRLRIYLVVKE
ncbi:MAG TPA: hypothetical protein VD903_07420 [Pseudonocardia sp.]|nr:hypothetical protein [Pseudonocardia sp.]